MIYKFFEYRTKENLLLLKDLLEHEKNYTHMTTISKNIFVD